MAIRVTIDTSLMIPAIKEFPEATSVYVEDGMLMIAKDIERPDDDTVSWKSTLAIAGFPMAHVTFWESYEPSQAAWQIDADRKPDTVSVG